jgi:signal transduction histidine kinase
MSGTIEHDRRVKAKHISWTEYVLTLFVLQVLTAGQMLILGAYIHLQHVPIGYILAMVAYWALATLIYCLVTSWQRFRLFDQPMRKLSAAAKQVAHGDFSVYVPPIHTADKSDYVDVMFEDFNRMVQELGSIETLKYDFIANVSHEIKTPLAVIQSYALALQQHNLSPEARNEYADTIMTASKKLTTLVTNILRLSKLENQAITPAAEPYDLCLQLSACALTFEEVWERKHIAFVADLEDRCAICAGKSMLEIVWNNLLSNALKFTDPGGTVTLTQTSDEDMVMVTVADTGCGMDPETTKHIFDKFYQGDPSRASEGNGLGLALVRKIIDMLDGTIAVASEPGTGTTFTVTLRTS